MRARQDWLGDGRWSADGGVVHPVDARAAAARARLASTWVASPFTARPLHRQLSLLLWTPVVVGLNLLVLGLAVTAFVHHSAEPLSSAGITAFFAVLLTLRAASRIVPFLEADDSGTTVHGLWTRTHLPWSAIEDVRLAKLPSSPSGDIKVVTGSVSLVFQTPEREVRSLMPLGSPAPGEPMDLLRTKLLLYRDRMRRPGEPVRPIIRFAPSLLRWIAAGTYLLMPAWLILAYYLDGGR